jgi:hypothetical protein
MFPLVITPSGGGGATKFCRDGACPLYCADGALRFCGVDSVLLSDDELFPPHPIKPTMEKTTIMITSHVSLECHEECERIDFPSRPRRK